MNKEEIRRFNKGSKERPVNNIYDLLNVMKGRENIIIYVKGNFELNEQALFEINMKNIEIINIR